MVLGPLEVVDQNTPIKITASMQRLVLAVLLLNVGRPVSVPQMVADFWGERPPPSARKTVHGYVWRLRGLIDRSCHRHIETVDSGYRLRADDVDFVRFERLVGAGRRASAAGDLPAAERRLSEALALWRGPALTNVPATPQIAVSCTRLRELRLSALAARFDIGLEMGQHRLITPELQVIVVEYPFNEEFHAQLMLSLYRCHRPAEALEVFYKLRSYLVDELGVEPSPSLQRLFLRILANDCALAAARPVNEMVL
ncbi:AfsR/SARP family transcriptional regulator [Nonomuraea sp. NPDC050643]|uniref:AfsR/SARP family transcriptional regulator n=1 Tax=Nonomuraea sp. NPDC050643 TaxID=3155660 RepID=UPI0033FC667A